MAAQGAPRFLLTFDFDETIVDENSDDSIVRAAPGQRLPESLRATHGEGFSNEYRRRVFQFLGEQGVRPRDLRAVCEAIPPPPGMGDLLQLVAKQGACFEVTLTHLGCQHLRRGERAARRRPPGPVPPHPQQQAGPDPRGLLALRPFHAHSCARCPSNRCKHKVLSDSRRERAQDRVPFERLCYVGDGVNDFCPWGCRPVATWPSRAAAPACTACSRRRRRPSPAGSAPPWSPGRPPRRAPPPAAGAGGVLRGGPAGGAPSRSEEGRSGKTI